VWMINGYYVGMEISGQKKRIVMHVDTVRWTI
jgi:hypothetical protein